MSENLFKSYIQNLDYDNIKFIILQGNINVESDDLKGNEDPLIILLRQHRPSQLHEKVSLILRYIINAGFNIHGSDSFSNTPIHYAMKNGYMEAISILLQHNANLTIKNHYGFTPIMLALEIKKKDLKELIIPKEFIDMDSLNKDVSKTDLIIIGDEFNKYVKENVITVPFKNFIEKLCNHVYENNIDKVKKSLFDLNPIKLNNNDIIKNILKEINSKTPFENFYYSDFTTYDERTNNFFKNSMFGGASNKPKPVLLNNTIKSYNDWLSVVLNDIEVQIYNYLIDKDLNVDLKHNDGYKTIVNQGDKNKIEIDKEIYMKEFRILPFLKKIKLNPKVGLNVRINNYIRNNLNRLGYDYPFQKDVFIINMPITTILEINDKLESIQSDLPEWFKLTQSVPPGYQTPISSPSIGRGSSRGRSRGRGISRGRGRGTSGRGGRGSEGYIENMYDISYNDGYYQLGGSISKPKTPKIKLPEENFTLVCYIKNDNEKKYFFLDENNNVTNLKDLGLYEKLGIKEYRETRYNNDYYYTSFKVPVDFINKQGGELYSPTELKIDKINNEQEIKDGEIIELNNHPVNKKLEISSISNKVILKKLDINDVTIFVDYKYNNETGKYKLIFNGKKHLFLEYGKEYTFNTENLGEYKLWLGTDDGGKYLEDKQTINYIDKNYFRNDIEENHKIRVAKPKSDGRYDFTEDFEECDILGKEIEVKLENDELFFDNKKLSEYVFDSNRIYKFKFNKNLNKKMIVFPYSVHLAFTAEGEDDKDTQKRQYLTFKLNESTIQYYNLRQINEVYKVKDSIKNYGFNEFINKHIQIIDFSSIPDYDKPEKLGFHYASIFSTTKTFFLGSIPIIYDDYISFFLDFIKKNDKVMEFIPGGIFNKNKQLYLFDTEFKDKANLKRLNFNSAKTYNTYSDLGLAYPIDYYKFYLAKNGEKFYISLADTYKKNNDDYVREFDIKTNISTRPTEYFNIKTTGRILVGKPHVQMFDEDYIGKTYYNNKEIDGKNNIFGNYDLSNPNIKLYSKNDIEFPSAEPVIPVITKFRVIYENELFNNKFLKLYSPEQFLQNFLAQVLNINPNADLISSIYKEVNNKLEMIKNNIDNTQNSLLEIIGEINLFDKFINNYICNIYQKYLDSIKNFNKFVESFKGKYFEKEINDYKNTYLNEQKKLVLNIEEEFDKIKGTWEEKKITLKNHIKSANSFRILEEVHNKRMNSGDEVEITDILEMIDFNKKDCLQAPFSFKGNITLKSKEDYSSLLKIEGGDNCIYVYENLIENYYNFKLNLNSAAIINSDKEDKNFFQKFPLIYDNYFSYLDLPLTSENDLDAIKLSYFFMMHIYNSLKFNEFKSNNLNIFKNWNENLKNNFIFNKLKNSFQNIIQNIYVEKLTDVLKNDGLEIDNPNLLVIQTNTRSNTIDVRDLKLLNDISDYNLLISNLGETLEKKYKECNKLWKQCFPENKDSNDGFDLFLEKIIVREDYDNTEMELIYEMYNFNLRMVSLCNKLGLWNQVNKFNNTLYSNLLLSNQFIKIKLAGKDPINQYKENKFLDNSIYKFLELLTNNLNLYKILGYKMFYKNINIETKMYFKENRETKNNYPIFGDDFLGCFLMIWDHTILKLFLKNGVSYNEYSNLEWKVKYLFPIEVEIDYLINKILSDKIICYPKLLNIDKELNKVNKKYSRKKIIDVLKNELDQLIIGKNNLDQLIIGKNNLEIQTNGDIEELQNIIGLLEFKQDIPEEINIVDAEEQDMNNLSEIQDGVNEQQKLEEQEGKITIYYYKDVFKNFFKEDTISFLSSVSTYLNEDLSNLDEDIDDDKKTQCYSKERSEHECINFLYVIYKNQLNILNKIKTNDNSKNGILEFLLNSKEIINKLEKILKNYIKIFPFSLDIISRKTPYVRNIKQNKSLKLFVKILSFVVSKYLGNNIYRLIVRLFAKDLFSKKEQEVKREQDLNIEVKGDEEEDQEKIYKDMEENLEDLKKYLTDGEFSNLIIKTVLNIKDEKNKRLEYESIDSLFENLVNRINELSINDNDLFSDFRTIGVSYYKQLFQKFIRNAFSVITNYNRFIINQYKYIRTIKELIKLITTESSEN